jgi:hypothetical protein
MTTFTNKFARALAILVMTMLVTGDAVLSYGQDAAVRTYSIVDVQANNMDIPGQGAQTIETTTRTTLDVSMTGENQYHVTITDISLEGSPMGDGGITGLIGLEADVTLGADGSIENISGTDDNAAVTTLGGPDVLKDRLQSIFLHGPGSDLSVGKKWTHTTELPSDQNGMTVERIIDSAYTVIGEEARDGVDTWVVQVKGEIAMSGSGAANGQNMDMAMEGQTDGKIYVDKSTGTLVGSETTGDIEGTIDLDAFSIMMTLSLNNTVSSTGK